MTQATNTTLGEIKLAGDLAGNNNALAPELTASGVTAGAYSIPSLTIDSKGRVTYAAITPVGDLLEMIPNASTTTKGIVQIGDNIDVASGVISIPNASDLVRGVIKVGSGLTVNDGIISTAIPDATTSTKGVVQVEFGGGIDVISGVISTTAIPDATTSTKGIVQIGDNIDVASGVISIPAATTSTLGVVKVGTGLVVSSGTISLDSSTYATSSTPGVVKIGSGLSVSSGVISVNIPVASASVLGAIKIGSGISIDGGGVISTAPGSVPDATTSTKGMVQIGTNIDVASGVISVKDASYTDKGVARIGTVGLSITSGVLNGVKANGTGTYGVVKSADTNNITITTGDINVGTNIPKKNTSNIYSKAQHVSISNPSFSSSLTLDFSLSNTFAFIPTSNFTLQNPSNISAGGIYHIVVKQDATGGRNITWGSYFKFTGVPPNIDTIANRTTIISIIAITSTQLLTQVIGGY